MTLVIVDDHAPFRAAARATLEADGFEVIGEASDATGAVAAVRILRPQIVLVDIGLPGRDGFSVAAALARGRRPPTIVLISSRDESDYGDLVARSGAAGFVAKADLTGAAVAAIHDANEWHDTPAP
jgi:DNA-binding NarL/FixJ family response regulator